MYNWWFLAHLEGQSLPWFDSNFMCLITEGFSRASMFKQQFFRKSMDLYRPFFLLPILTAGLGVTPKRYSEFSIREIRYPKMAEPFRFEDLRWTAQMGFFGGRHKVAVSHNLRSPDATNGTWNIYPFLWNIWMAYRLMVKLWVSIPVPWSMWIL